MRAAGNEVRQVRATGGFARSPLWRQMLADVLGIDVAFTAAREGSSFGAALLGMQALGRVASIDVAADLVQVESTVRPEPGAAATYAAMAPMFAELYDALTPAFRTLRRLEPGRPREVPPGQ
jgi:gluconokinase